MATVQENHEAADLAHAKSENSVEPVTVKVSDQELTSVEQAEMEAVGSEHADTDPTNKEAVISEEAEAEPVSTDPLLSETTNKQVSEEQLDSEPGSQQSANIHPHPDASKELAPQPVSSEMIISQSVSSQPADAEAQPNVATATVTEESQEMVYEKAVNVEALSADPISSDHNDQQQAGSVLVHSEAVISDQVTAEAEPMNVDLPEQQLSGSELAYSQPDVPELDASQPFSSGLVHSHPVGPEVGSSQHISTEFVNSQSLDHKTQSGMYYMETLHHKSELVKMEHMYTEPANSEAVSSDLDQQLQVSSELMDQLQVGPELGPIQTIGSEIVHSQPVNSDLVHSEPFGSEYDNSQTVGSEMANMQIVATDMVNYEPVDPETQPNKRRKKKSIVWEHFTIETVGEGCRRACCKVCKQSFAYSTGSKVAGTSHLKRHIAKGTCAVMLRQQGKNQLTPYTPKTSGAETGTPATTDPPKRRYRTSSSPYLIFDQERCRHEIAKMIIMHEYPLNMVEHPGFVAFVQHLQPRFDMVNFSAVQGDCVATYLREKHNLQKFIDGMPGRICLTLDMWTSGQTTGYVFLHGQFIDHDWKLHRRLLNVVPEPFPESDTALSHAAATCLSYWNLDNKLCSVTFNQPVSEAGQENMRGLLSLKNPLVLNGQLLVGSCMARTLSGMALDALAAGQDIVSKIRSSVKYMKMSDAHEDKFLELKQQLQVPSEKSLILDNVTKWNTTYYMLLAACELKEVFSCMDTSDPEYNDAPTMEDWQQAENICTFLKLLLDMANLLLSKTPPSTNIFFHEVWKIQLELNRNAASDDPFVSNIAKTLQDKFLKYWKDTCLVLAIAVAMDPRFKMKLVEFSFTKLFVEEASAYVKVVDDGIHELFHEYTTFPLALPPAYSEEGKGDVKGEDNHLGGLISSNGLSDFDMYIMETTSQHTKSELDQYLEESLLPRVQEIDVLGWWKLNQFKYPTLSKMARDILSIPLSSVGPENVFDTVSKEMDQYRSSLRPETLEALMCAKDWLQHGQSDLS